MTGKSAIGVSGLGVYVPEGRVSSAEIAAASGLPAWVVTDKLGISAKPKPGPNDHPTAMGVWAAERALSASGLSPEDVDVVVCITEEYKEYPVWTAGIKLAHDLGAANAYAYDIGQKCGTGVLGLKQAKDLLLADESVQTVLVAGGYRNGDLIDFCRPRRALYVQPGRGRRGGGGAAGSEAIEILDSHILTDGAFSLDVRVPVGGTVEPLTPENAERYKLEVPDPAGMKARLGDKSLENFLKVISQSCREVGL